MSQFAPQSIDVGEPEETDTPQAQAALNFSIDQAIERAISSGDWPACRAELIELDGSAKEYEGYPFALATTAYYADHDPLTALRLAHAALNRPLSRWRPDTFRLLAIVLEECGQPQQARDALKLGLVAVDDLAIPQEEKAQYRQWLAEALPPDLPDGSEEHLGTGVGRDSTVETEDDVDRRLESALATGNWEAWQQHRDGKSGARAKPHCEGEYLGLASAAYAEHNTNLAEKLVRSALAAKESRWRTESYRLLGEILQRRGKLEAAETALDAAIDAVRKLSLREDEKEAYVQSIDEALLPIRVQLLEKDRSGVKSVLRNGIITGERTDKRECRETLIALKNFERSWFPDFLSALIYTVQFSGRPSNTGSVLRAARSAISATLRLLLTCLKIGIAVSALVAVAYFVAAFTPLGCRQKGSDLPYCGGAVGAYIRSFASNLPDALETLFRHASTAGSVRAGAYAASLTILAVMLIIVLAKLGKAFIAMISTRYFIRDGRVTIRTGLFRRVRKNYEIIHASRFIIDQGITQTLLRRARLSFYSISVGGQSPEEVVIIGRSKFVLNLDRDIRGLNRMMRSVARLKGIVSLD